MYLSLFLPIVNFIYRTLSTYYPSFLPFISSMQFGDQIIDTIDKGGLLGAMARWYFSPQGPPPSPTSEINGKVPSWYRPRLSLRFLASYRAMVYLALLYFALVYFCDITVTGFVLFLLAAALFVGFVGTLV